MARILAVDDSKAIRDLVASVLTEAGHDVVSAADGVEALAAANRQDFDLVLSDINMPRMDGIELISELRKIKSMQYVPMIMITTENTNEKKLDARSSGASGWMAKPFTPTRLLNAVGKLLDR